MPAPLADRVGRETKFRAGSELLLNRELEIPWRNLGPQMATIAAGKRPRRRRRREGADCGTSFGLYRQVMLLLGDAQLGHSGRARQHGSLLGRQRPRARHELLGEIGKHAR